MALPYSYELDNAPRFERFYFVASGERFAVAKIIDIVRKAAKGGVLPSVTFPKGFQAAVFTVNKESGR